MITLINALMGSFADISERIAAAHGYSVLKHLMFKIIGHCGTVTASCLKQIWQ